MGTETLKQKTLKAWIKALRSGKYKQTYSVLSDSKARYCCLGVLCEVAGLNYEEDRDGNKIYDFGITGIKCLHSAIDIPYPHPLEKTIGERTKCIN